MRAFFQRNWFLCLLVLVLTVGFSQSHALAAIPHAIPETWLVAAVLFVMTLPLDFSSMWQALRRPKAVLLAVAINYGLLPLAAWGVSFAMQPEFGQGLLIAASIPTTLASCAVLTRRAGGNDAVAVLATVVTNLLCFIVTPFWLAVTSVAAGMRVPGGPLGMALRLLLLVVVPMIAAQSLRLVPSIGRSATQAKTPLGVLAQMGLLLMVLIGAITAGKELSRHESMVTPAQWAVLIVSVSAIHLAMLASGHLLGRAIGLAREDRIAVGFAGSQKTLTVGLHIAISQSGGLAMLPMVAYHVCQLLLDTVIANRLRDRLQCQPSLLESSMR